MFFYLQKKSFKKSSLSIVDYISAYTYLPYFSSKSFISNEPTWKFCIGGNGQVLSVVQHNTLEMRTEKHYNKTLAKATCKIFLCIILLFFIDFQPSSLIHDFLFQFFNQK